jgi:hypothetical protein
LVTVSRLASVAVGAAGALGALTVKLVFADTPEPECVAVIVVLPVATVVASPWLPSALLIVATPVLEEDQATELLTSRLVPSV